jgi:hypothetical protein
MFCCFEVVFLPFVNLFCFFGGTLVRVAFGASAFCSCLCAEFWCMPSDFRDRVLEQNREVRENVHGTTSGVEAERESVCITHA